MLGAIIGDFAGSIYEYEQTKKVKKVKIKNIIEDNAFFSDDTILTIAMLDAILNKKEYSTKLKEYFNKYENYLPSTTQYFKTIFSPGFTSWAKGDFIGQSIGNGAMMRISPIGFLFSSEMEIIKNVELATNPSHNSKEAINCAGIIALIIFYAKNGLSKKEIIKKLNLKIKKPKIRKFNYTCLDTIDICLYSFFKSKSFEDSIKKAIYFGGDTDTNACIVGGMAEAFYGIENNLKQKVYEKLPQEFIEILNLYYKNS